MVIIKRVYDPAGSADGYRVLVDRLWPRGVSKERAAVDAWLKAVAPSPELRVWFGHDPARFSEFTVRYEQELARNPALRELQALADAHPALTLIYAAKDSRVNHAVILQRILSR